MSTDTDRGLTSIIVPCWNQLEFTRQCIAALVRHTRMPWELIVIDNGSTDGTGAYVSGVQDAAAVPVTVIGNGENRGFPAAVNQGLQQARGDYLVLLNNDVVVTDAWLDQLIALAEMRIDTHAEPDPPPYPPPQGGRHLNAQASVEYNGGRTKLTMIDFNGGDPVVVEDSIDGVLGKTSSPAACLADSASAPPPFDPAVAGRSLTSPYSFDLAVAGCSLTTPPGPPFTRGGKPARTPSSSLPTANCVLPTLGLVGPMSNYATPPQLVENVPYRDMGEMQGFARMWRDRHRGQWFTVPKLSGFCLLMKRAVYEAIGGLDERFGMGLFDDDDLGERSRRAGFELAVAHDLFVHHFGSRTFAGNGVDAGKLLDENARRFAAKWGLNGNNGRKVSLRPFVDGKSAVPDSTGTAAIYRRGKATRFGLSADSVKVTLTVIARDEEKNLPKCLESVRGLFDEIVVIDTGSHHRTAEIARSFGAKVFDFPWIDDFAAARNAALERATGDYAFWLDADDVVDPPQREKLRALLDGLGRLPGPRSRPTRRFLRLGRSLALPKGVRPRTSFGAPATRPPMEPAAIRSSTTSASFRSGRECAGRIACTNRFCRHYARRRFPCAGPM